MFWRNTVKALFFRQNFVSVCRELVVGRVQRVLVCQVEPIVVVNHLWWNLDIAILLIRRNVIIVRSYS